MIPRIGLAQINVSAGRPDLNLATMLSAIERARGLGLELVAFPEMAVPGYLIGDVWENDRFLQDCLAANEILREASQNLCVVWGNVDVDFDAVGEDGRARKFNAAWIAQDKAWVDNGVLPGRTYKTLLPNYREFDDKRYFVPFDRWQPGRALADLLKPFPIRAGSRNPATTDDSQQAAPKGPTPAGQTTRIGLMLCEDMWDADYAIKPGRELEANGAELLLNLSCSPWTWRKNAKRHRVARTLVQNAGIPLYYVNNVGIQNNGKDIYAFDGASTIYDQHGNPSAIQPPFAEGILTLGDEHPLSADARSDAQPSVSSGETAGLALEAGTTSFSGAASGAGTGLQDTEETCNTLLYVLRRYCATLPSKKVAIGLSGGIDSAVNATLLALALGSENVYAVNMPSRFNSATTKNAAAELAKNLGIHYAVMPIQESVDLTIAQLEATTWNDGGSLKLSGLNKENIQARDRGGRILAGVASAIGGIFTNNGNKTEIAFGYATLYGDVNGALCPLGDLYKTQVYALARHLNEHYGNAIPRAILDVVPSAELSEAQNVDEGKGDPINYLYHDKLLFQWIDGGYQTDYEPSYARRDPYDLLRWYVDHESDTRLGLPEGTVRRFFPDAASYAKDLEEKWSWYQRNVFKRVQTPPIIALSKRAFGFDLRESVNGVYLSDRYRKLKASIGL